MVDQTLDLVTPSAPNHYICGLQTTWVPAGELREGQHVLHQGARLKVRRVVPAFTRSHACHVHLVPLNWQPSAGISQELANRNEAAMLIRVACPTFKAFQVVI
jgi:hypothetical protein